MKIWRKLMRFLWNERDNQESSCRRSAVFIGRCSTEILKSCEDVVTVFVRCSDKEKRVQRIFDKENVDTMQKARRLMDRKDWGRKSILSSGRKGLEGREEL